MEFFLFVKNVVPVIVSKSAKCYRFFKYNFKLFHSLQVVTAKVFLPLISRFYLGQMKLLLLYLVVRICQSLLSVKEFLIYSRTLFLIHL